MEGLSTFNLFAGWGLIALVLLMAIFGFYMIVAFRIKPMSKPLFPFLGPTSEEYMKLKLHNYGLFVLSALEDYMGDRHDFFESVTGEAVRKNLIMVDKHGDYCKVEELRNYERELK